VRLGWDSPVKEVVHPQFINLQSRGGLGWLEGFNEWMVRCGLEWAGHPGWVMFDISNPDYLAAWATAVEAQLGDGGWTGVELVDAGNLPAWTNSPIDPNTGQDMTVSDHARYLAEAMAEVRGGLKSNNFAVIAQNQPFTIIDPHQIASSDAVSVERGFARLQGSAWTSLYTYFEAALDARVGPGCGTADSSTTSSACSAWPPTCWCPGSGRATPVARARSGRFTS
jgi:hypothetical protein